jgi:hypothetical protein
MCTLLGWIMCTRLELLTPIPYTPTPTCHIVCCTGTRSMVYAKPESTFAMCVPPPCLCSRHMYLESKLPQFQRLAGMGSGGGALGGLLLYCSLADADAPYTHKSHLTMPSLPPPPNTHHHHNHTHHTTWKFVTHTGTPPLTVVLFFQQAHVP